MFLYTSWALMLVSTTTIAVDITSQSSDPEAGNIQSELLDLFNLTSILTNNITLVSDIQQDASNYVINATDINKKFLSKGKKYRLLKVKKDKLKSDSSSNDDILRNIKLEVDGKGNRKVPNLFRIKRKKKYPNYVRKHRQIYREDLKHIIEERTEKSKHFDNVAEESQTNKIFAHFPGTDSSPRTTRLARVTSPIPPRVIGVVPHVTTSAPYVVTPQKTHEIAIKHP